MNCVIHTRASCSKLFFWERPSQTIFFLDVIAWVICWIYYINFMLNLLKKIDQTWHPTYNCKKFKYIPRTNTRHITCIILTMLGEFYKTKSIELYYIRYIYLGTVYPYRNWWLQMVVVGFKRKVEIVFERNGGRHFVKNSIISNNV